MFRGRQSSGRTPILNTLCFVLPLVSFVILILVVVAGVTPQALTQLYYFSVEADNLELDSKLSSSQFLKDLGEVSGTNLVGSKATTKSLGLSERYTVHLLTSCGYDGDETTCTTPEFGYAFDPRVDLKLDDTVLEGTFSSDFVDAVDHYAKLSPFVAAGHLVSLIIMFATTVAVCFVGRAPKLGLVLMLLSWVSSLIGLAASIAEVVGVKQYVSAFNKDLEEVGITASEGNLFYASLVAAILCLASSVLTTIKWRKARANAHRPYPRSGPGLTSVGGVEKDDLEASKPSGRNMGPKPLTLLQRIPTWGQHKYVQVEKQTAVVNPDQGDQQEGKGKRRAEEAVLMMDPMDERDEDDAAAAESEGPKAIAMKKIDPKPEGESRRVSSEDEGDVSLRTGGSIRDVASDSAYDPYAAPAAAK